VTVEIEAKTTTSATRLRGENIVDATSSSMVNYQIVYVLLCSAEPYGVPTIVFDGSATSRSMLRRGEIVAG
jgi:hypothetical protein